uniref:FHA domain-containing protein n=1 Tax=Musca domestica TaxID=7370 RepID=A0A1I8N6F5_MUSDO
MTAPRYSSWVLERSTIGECHRLRLGLNSVGRHSSSLIRILDSHYVSRHHAEVEVSQDDQSVTIKDLNSVNGIFVNNTLHKSSTITLNKGDTIGIGVSIQCSEEDELTLPIYELKYMPITRAKGASSSNSAQSAVPNKSNQERASTSTHVSASKPVVEEAILIISDDEEGVETKGSGGKSAANPTASPNSRQMTNNLESKDNLPKQGINDNKTEDVPSKSIPPYDSNVKSFKNEDDVEKSAAKKESGIQENRSQNKNNGNPSAITAGPAANAQENDNDPTKIHIPIIPSIKQELIHSVSADVKDIFGELDDEQKNTLKEINPMVYNDLSGQPLIPATHTDNPIVNGECITLLSDDDTAGDEEELGILTSTSATREENFMEDTKPAKLPNPPISKSPNIFNTSLNDSLEEDNSTQKALAVLKNHLNAQKSKDSSATVANDNVDLEDYTSYEPHSDDEDIEEFMFSQVLINDMKAELQDDFDKDIEEEVPSADHPHDNDLKLPIKIKEEPDLERSASLLNELDNSCWVISDDEDYDKELETKVSGWSNKIFSQSFNYNNQSQVYDLDDNLSDEDAEEIGHEQDPSHGTDLDNVEEEEEEELAHIADLYSSGNEIFSTDQTALGGIKMKECSVSLTRLEQTTSTNREKSPDVDRNRFQSPIDNDSPLIRPRRKIISKCKAVASSSSSSSEDEFEGVKMAEVINKVAEFPAQFGGSANEVQQTKGKPVVRPPPAIISAPSLPKHKGKLRGVSAEKSPTILKHQKIPALSKKLNSLREQIRHEEINKILKKKWTEKPSVGKKRDKQRMEMIKECRKDRLKQLAEKHPSPAKDNLKRKSTASTSSDHADSKAKKAKVKVTEHNRGAFLAQNDVEATTWRKNDVVKKSSATFKIPKVPANHCEISKNKEPLKPRSNSTNETPAKKDPIKRSTSMDCGLTTFSQEIAKPDNLLLKKPETKPGIPSRRLSTTATSCINHNSSFDKDKETTTIPNRRLSTTSVTHNPLHPSDTPAAVCKEALAARALRTTNKITFASMEKNLIESEKNKNKLNSISTQRCSKQDGTLLISILSPKKNPAKKRKTVRFNDVPVIHYIERISGARKVAAKDILPLSTHKDRRQLIRRTYPIIDNTDQIITQILTWSDEWLVKRNAAVDAASDIVYPMPTQFSSFDHYKSIVFPLMKLEFVSLLEREYNLTSKVKKYKVALEYVTTNANRLMLVTKFNYQNRQQLDSSKYDLVILESNKMNANMFGYLTSTRKGAGSCSTMVFEIVPKNITKDFFCGIHELTIRPVIDNVRVEFGAFNAVYQLQATPLFKKILDPMEMLQCRHPPKKKVIYRGFDPLNDKQRQVLLNTYVRIIDETTPNVSLLQGPPGTGKSCVITNLALQTLYGDEVRCMDKKILICAQSNAAVDVIAGKLYDISMRMRPEIRFRLIRYGLQDKINRFVYPVTLQAIIEHEQMKKLKSTNPEIPLENKENLKNQILQLEAQIAEMSKRNIKGTVEEDMLLEKQRKLQLMRNISTQFTRPEDERSIATWFLNNANIVCATLSSCVKLAQYVNYFDICIIDEATQCTEPWTLLPLRFGINSLVLVGDTQQLPATILSKKANELGLGTSMFTRIQNCLDNLPSTASASSTSGLITKDHIICGLQTQYRMNPEICRWPNQYFYRNELINGRITMEYKTPLMPFSVLNLAYTQNASCSNGKITNNLEAEFVAKLLKALDGFIPNKYNSYGVITPYAHHRTTLEHSIRSLGLTNIMVNTIDSYQGLEKDVIVISNARTNGIGFLSNPQRLNVALTRPKKCLILCGNFKNLEVVPAWRSLLQSARERNLYYEISTNCVNDIQTNVIDKIRINKKDLNTNTTKTTTTATTNDTV